MNKIEKRRRRVESAIRGGEILRVQYIGGSSPGEIREIAPTGIQDSSIFLAICLRSNEVKSFRFDRTIFLDELFLSLTEGDFVSKNHDEMILGFIEGVLSDDVIAIKEVEGFVKYLDENPDAKACWPGDVVYSVCSAHISNELRGKSIFQHFLEIRSTIKKKSA